MFCSSLVETIKNKALIESCTNIFQWIMVLMGCLLSKKLVYKFIEHAIKNESMKGQKYQYNFPQIPLGLKVAAWYKVLLIILNSSHACPGSFISAYRTSLPSSLLAYKTQKSSSL
jgi:hypothetical protein